MDSLLKEAQEAFSQWHANRKRQGKFTDALKKMALELLEHYPVLTVSNITGVTVKTLTQWKQQVDPKEENTINFISLPMTETAVSHKADAQTPVNKGPELMLTLPGHLQLTLPSQSLDKTIQFIHALSKEFCS